MRITGTTGSPALLLRPEGRIEADTCSDLRHQLGAAFAVGVRSVVVDLRDVTSLDPTGLGVLAGASKHLRKRGGALVVTHPCPAVLKTLRINAMTDLLEIPASPPLRGLPAPVAATGGRAARATRSRGLAVVPTPAARVVGPETTTALPG